MMAKNSQDNFFENCWQVMANYPQLINNYWFNSFKKMDNSNFDQFNNISEILGKLLKDNDLISEYQRKWLENCWQIFDNISDSNANDNSELFTEDAKDNRFKDEAWQNNPFFNAVKQVYIMNLKLAIDFIEKNDELEQQEKGKLNFFIRYLFDSCSPTNYFLTNPTIIKETIDSKAENLLKGMRKLRSDFENQVDLFHMKSVDESKFKIGENVAATKGKVIFKNKILELIAYYPQHNESYAVPLLIVPPCIKKYYILDLQENNSMVKFLLDKNFVVLIVSWKNPDYRDAEVSFEDYIESLV